MTPGALFQDLPESAVDEIRRLIRDMHLRFEAVEGLSRQAADDVRTMKPTVEGAVEIVQAWAALKVVGGWAKWLIGVVTLVITPLALWYDHIKTQSPGH